MIYQSFKLFSFSIFMFTTIESCKPKVTHSFTQLEFNSKILDSLMKEYGTKVAILSCLKCDCFRLEYIKFFERTKKEPEGYKLLADSNCVKLNFRFNHLPNKTTNLLSEDIYNLVLIQKKGEEISYKILNLSESTKIQAVANAFFK